MRKKVGLLTRCTSEDENLIAPDNTAAWVAFVDDFARVDIERYIRPAISSKPIAKYQTAIEATMGIIVCAVTAGAPCVRT